MAIDKWQLLLPDLEQMTATFLGNWSHFAHHWWSTFSVSSVAAIIALACAVVLSILAVRFRIFRLVMSPLVALSQSFPLQAIAPLIIMVLGVGFLTKSVIAFLIALFPMFNACLSSLLTTPHPLVAKLAVSEASFLNGMVRVRLPAALPTLCAACKVGFTLAVLGAVVAEFIQPDEGLGTLLMIAQSNYNVEVIYICVGLLIVQGVTVFSVISAFESHLLKGRSYQ